MIDKKNTRNEKNAQTQRDRNTAADMDETRADGDDDDEGLCARSWLARHPATIEITRSSGG